MAIQKHYIYQMWDSTGTIYLGVLAGVTSQFSLAQEINSIGPAVITVSVAQNADTSYLPTKAITTEDGLWITTESGVGLTTEGEPTNYAVPNSKIRNGNLIKITEVSDYHPTGIVVFNGFVRKWNVNFGTNDDSTLTCVTKSYDLNGHLVKSGEVLSYSLTSFNKSYAVFGGSGTSANRIAYQFPVAARGISNYSSFTLLLSAQSSAVTVTLNLFQLYSNNPGSGDKPDFAKMDNASNAVATTSVIVTGSSPTEYTFTFPVPFSAVTTTAYWIEVESSGTSGTGALVYYTSASADGTPGIPPFLPTSLISAFDPGTSGDWLIGTPGAGPDIYGEFYFKQYTIPAYTKATITNFEPTNVVKTIINNYNGEGGFVTYTPTSLQLTGVTISSFTFSTNTATEGITAMLAFAPKDFYYTIDAGTNILTFAALNKTTPDFTFIYRRHINNLDLSASIEQVENDIYFTGGKNGTTNVYVHQSDAASIKGFLPTIGRPSDPRITNQDAANSAASVYLAKSKDEVYESVLVIPDKVADISQFRNGMTIGFEGFGTFADSLILPIVRFERSYDSVTLYVGALPPRQTQLINDVTDTVATITTVDNPTQPS